MARLQIAALGSSFAAGPGIDPCIDKDAMRSGRNYAYQLAERLEADLTDLTVSGATLLNVLNEAQIMRSGTTFPAQLDSLPSDVDIVTLTIGGNDMGYISGMIYDSIMASTGPLQWLLRRCVSHPNTGLGPNELSDRFVAVIERIKEVAPQATVILVEYLTIFGDHAEPNKDHPLSREEIAAYQRQAAELARAYEDAAKARENVHLVRMAEMSRVHGLGSTEPWMNGFSWMMLFRGEMPYHPNLAGHTAAAEEVYELIRKDRR